MKLLKWIIKIPYSFAWQLTNAANNPFPIVYYCKNLESRFILEIIVPNIPELTIVTGNRRIQEKLFENDISSILWPCYPNIVIMDEDISYLFPSKKIKKIGLKLRNSDFNKSKDITVLEIPEKESSISNIELIKEQIRNA